MAKGTRCTNGPGMPPDSLSVVFALVVMHQFNYLMGLQCLQCLQYLMLAVGCCRSRMCITTVHACQTCQTCQTCQARQARRRPIVQPLPKRQRLRCCRGMSNWLSAPDACPASLRYLILPYDCTTARLHDPKYHLLEPRGGARVAARAFSLKLAGGRHSIHTTLLTVHCSLLNTHEKSAIL